MTQLIDQAIDEIRKRSPVDQEAIAAIILEELKDEDRWDRTFAQSQDKLAKMAAKAREELRAGKVRDVGIDEL